MALSKNVPHLDNPSLAIVHARTPRAAFKNLVSVANLKLPGELTIAGLCSLKAFESFAVLLPFLSLKARRSIYYGILLGQWATSATGQ